MSDLLCLPSNTKFFPPVISLSDESFWSFNLGVWKFIPILRFHAALKQVLWPGAAEGFWNARCYRSAPLDWLCLFFFSFTFVWSAPVHHTSCILEWMWPSPSVFLPLFGTVQMSLWIIQKYWPVSIGTGALGVNKSKSQLYTVLNKLCDHLEGYHIGSRRGYRPAAQGRCQTSSFSLRLLRICGSVLSALTCIYCRYPKNKKNGVVLTSG